MAHPDISALNRASWSTPLAVANFSDQGFVDAGEQAAFLAVASRVRGQPAIDIGVGTGRTVPLVRLLTDDYVAMDYAPDMVVACRHNHPDVDVRIGDVRDLAQFGDACYGLVLFSFNGIDNLAHEDRARALAELLRVARPGGWVMFSTHNLAGPSYREAPWRGYRSSGSSWYRALRWAARLPFELPRHARRWRNWLRNRHLNRFGGDWAEHISAPNDFGLVQHYVTLDALYAELTQAGFGWIEVYGSESGRRLRMGDDAQPVNSFHVIAQRPSASAAVL